MILKGQGFSYSVPSRAKGNQLYVPELDRIVLKVPQLLLYLLSQTCEQRRHRPVQQCDVTEPAALFCSWTPLSSTRYQDRCEQRNCHCADWRSMLCCELHGGCGFVSCTRAIRAPLLHAGPRISVCVCVCVG